MQHHGLAVQVLPPERPGDRSRYAFPCWVVPVFGMLKVLGLPEAIWWKAIARCVQRPEFRSRLVTSAEARDIAGFRRMVSQEVDT